MNKTIYKKLPRKWKRFFLVLQNRGQKFLNVHAIVFVMLDSSSPIEVLNKVRIDIRKMQRKGYQVQAEITQRETYTEQQYYWMVCEEKLKYQINLKLIKVDDEAIQNAWRLLFLQLHYIF